MIQNLTDTTLDNRYRFGTVIGEGTFARVYRVHDSRRNADLAAKVLREDIAHEPTFIERFRREAGVLQQLQHPNIVRYYGTVETEDVVFILLDYIPGDNLQTYLYKLGEPLTVAQALQFIKPLSAALHYAHGENIIHRDIKPANILLGDNGQVYITDFGIARLLNEASTLTQDTAVGTPLYMAPEQIHGKEVTLAADIYGVGVLLYQMFTGTVPFTGNHPQAEGSTVSQRVAYEHLNLPPIDPTKHNPALHDAAKEVVLRCLQKEPTARYSSALTIYDALAEAIGATPGQMDAVEIEGKPIPPDATLPEWSQVLKKVETPTEADQAKVEPAITTPTVLNANHPTARPTLLHTPAPQPNWQQIEAPQPSPPSDYFEPQPHVPSSHPSRSGSLSSQILFGLLLGAIVGLAIACLGALLFALGIFDSDSKSNETARPSPTTEIIQSSTPTRSNKPNLFATQTVAPSPTLLTPNTQVATSGEQRVFAYAKQNNGSLDIFQSNTSDGTTIAISRALGATLLTIRSPIIMSPSVISSSPASILRLVDLPHPEGPTKTRNSPSSISIVRSLITSTSPKRLKTF